MSPEFGAFGILSEPAEAKAKITNIYFDQDENELVIDTIDQDGNEKTVRVKIDE